MAAYGRAYQSVRETEFRAALQQFRDSVPHFQLWIWLVLLMLTILALRLIYRCFFSPLARFPGPRLWAALSVPSGLSTLRGKNHKALLRLHETYGTVVRIGPNELSFCSPQAFRDMYQSTKTRSELAKHPSLYQSKYNGLERSVAGYIDDANHSRQRRVLSHVFSDRAISEQEPVIVGYIDYLIASMRSRPVAQGQHGYAVRKIDFRTWINYLTFDITGDLMFGESFKCIENQRFHPWIAEIFKTIKAVTYISVINNYSVFRLALDKFLPASVRKTILEHRQFTARKVDARLAAKVNRPDFLNYVLKNGLSDESGDFKENDKIMSREEIHMNAFIITLTSETTATLMSGCIFYLCNNPAALEKVVTEVRTAFSADTDIRANVCMRLKYLNAVIEESLRIYPPIATAFPRVTPPEGCIIDGQFVPGNVTVSIHHYAAYHHESNFIRPKEFIPERWLDNSSEFLKDKRDVVNPFSIGPRNCLGKKFAYQEMRLILAKLLFNFDVQICEESRNWIDQNVYIVWEKPSLWVELKDRAM